MGVLSPIGLRRKVWGRQTAPLWVRVRRPGLSALSRKLSARPLWERNHLEPASRRSSVLWKKDTTTSSATCLSAASPSPAGPGVAMGLEVLAEKGNTHRDHMDHGGCFLSVGGLPREGAHGDAVPQSLLVPGRRQAVGQAEDAPTQAAETGDRSRRGSQSEPQQKRTLADEPQQPGKTGDEQPVARGTGRAKSREPVGIHPLPRRTEEE
jgi:hypothetical protein